MPPDRQALAEQTHRRETRLYIILPLVAGIMIVLAGAGITLLLPRRFQVSIIADLLLTVVMLCPVVICLFPIAIGLAAAAFGMNRLHDATARPLRRLDGMSGKLLERTANVTETINQRTINLSVRLAFLDKLLGVFDDPAEASAKDSVHEHTPGQ